MSNEQTKPRFLAPYTCPKCGSTDYDELMSRDSSDAVGYICRCLACGTQYVHWSNLEYIPYGVEVGGVTYEYPRDIDGAGERPAGTGGAYAYHRYADDTQHHAPDCVGGYITRGDVLVCTMNTMERHRLHKPADVDAEARALVDAANARCDMLNACRDELEALTRWRVALSAISKLDPSIADVLDGMDISVAKLADAIGNTGGAL